MIIRVYLDVDFLNDEDYRVKGYKTHVINLTNEAALERLQEHIQCETLDMCDLKPSDCAQYDPERD